MFILVADIEMMADDESDDDVPTIMIGNRLHPVNEVDDSLIAKMSPQEKDQYIQVYQEYFSHLYD